MTKAEQIRTIRAAYSEIPDLYDGFKEVSYYLRDLNDKAERQHRKGAPYGIKHGLSIADAARLFTVKYLLDGWNDPKWTIAEVNSVRFECLSAQAYAQRFKKELEQWAQKWTAPFDEVDYAFLMK